MEQQELADAELVRRALGAATAQERTVAFEGIADRYRFAVLRQCARWFPDPEAAQDVGQAAFEAAFTLLADGKGPGRPDKLAGWLIEIARRRGQEYVRKAHPAGVRWAVLPEGQSLDDQGDDEEPRSGSAVRRAHAARLVEVVVSTLTERQQQVYQLRFAQELTGRQVAGRLGIADKAASNEATQVQNLIADGFGALILLQEGRAYCPDLARILDSAQVTAMAGTTAFTAALRERIVHHFDDCKICDHCRTCNNKRRELVGPYAPGLIPILFGPAFLARIARVISRTARPGAPRRRSRRGPRRLGNPALAAAIVVTALIVAGLIAALVAGAFGSGAGPAARTAPALVYTTSTSVDLRAGNGSVRTLATFPKGAGFTGPQGFGSGQLAWSAEGSKVAWLDSQGVGEFIVGRDQVRTWHCDCSSIVFQGDRLLSDDGTAENAPRLLSYPDDGSKPVPIVISGLPKSKFTAGAYSLVAGVPPADVIVGYGTGVSASGGPQLLYRVDAEGRAVLFAPVAPQMIGNTAPGRFVFSPDGTQVGFLLGGLAGVCADGDTVVLANVATGAETQPAMPPGMRYALAVWFGSSGTPYASMAPVPPGCAHVGQGTVASIVVSPQDYRLEAGTWVRSGSGVINEESIRGGWEATRYGKVDSTALGASVSTDPRLVVSRGSSSVTIPGALTFMWAPSAAPTSSAASSPAPSAVSSPALPPRRQAAQALAALLAQSGTDRTSVTQAVSAVADCSPGLSQDETIFGNAASSRQALLGKLVGLPDRSALPASMLQDLTTAWQASGEADQDFANWTQDEISQGCSTNYQSDASYQATTVPDDQATKDKKAFAALWTAIANEYGLPSYQYNQI
jgi:RNA polymerase sigma factor (sigma-70 family)